MCVFFVLPPTLLSYATRTTHNLWIVRIYFGRTKFVLWMLGKCIPILLFLTLNNISTNPKSTLYTYKERFMLHISFVFLFQLVFVPFFWTIFRIFYIFFCFVPFSPITFWCFFFHLKFASFLRSHLQVVVSLFGKLWWKINSPS